MMPKAWLHAQMVTTIDLGSHRIRGVVTRVSVTNTPAAKGSPDQVKVDISLICVESPTIRSTPDDFISAPDIMERVCRLLATHPPPPHKIPDTSLPQRMFLQDFRRQWVEKTLHDCLMFSAIMADETLQRYGQDWDPSAVLFEVYIRLQLMEEPPFEGIRSPATECLLTWGWEVWEKYRHAVVDEPWFVKWKKNYAFNKL